jgi:thermostable 8-oxoguanine DNA glycosylase
MIDPFNITNYNRTDYELEEFFLFCLSVAGKKATMIAQKLDDFLIHTRHPDAFFKTPFSWLSYLHSQNGNGPMIRQQLERVKMGKYELLTKGFEASIKKGTTWFRTATADMIAQEIPGAGYKTSRFFVLHSRENANVAVIDTHMLKYLKHIGAANVPDGIPTGNEYLRLEAILLAEAKSKNMKMADFDLAIWSHYASKGQTLLP